MVPACYFLTPRVLIFAPVPVHSGQKKKTAIPDSLFF
jgi:hypothetical protein